MTLWMLLLGATSVAPIFAGFREGLQRGPLSAAVGLLIGLAIAAAWFRTLLTIRQRALNTWRAREPSFRIDMTVALLYFATFGAGFALAGIALVATRFATS